MNANVHTPQRLAGESFQAYKNRRRMSHEINWKREHAMPQVLPTITHEERADRMFRKDMIAESILRSVRK